MIVWSGRPDSALTGYDFVCVCVCVCVCVARSVCLSVHPYSDDDLAQRLQALKRNRATREQKIARQKQNAPTADAPAPAPAPALPVAAPVPEPAPQAAPLPAPFVAATPARAEAPPIGARVPASDDRSVDLGEERHRVKEQELLAKVQALTERLAIAEAAPSPGEGGGGGGEELERLRSESRTLREENASLRNDVRDVRGQLEDQRRAAKRKVAELENLLRHVTEELAKQGDAAKMGTDIYQLQEDNARLEEELNRVEAMHENTVAELEQRLRAAEATAPSSDELVRLKKEKAAIEIVMNQIAEELEEEKHARELAEKRAAGSAARPEALVDNSAMTGMQSQLPAMGTHDTARTQEALFQELDRAKAEIRNQRNHIDDLERDLTRARHEKDTSEDDRERDQRAAEAEAKKKQLEYTGHLTELQMELAHVCNVLAAMDDRCKVLELTQEDTNVLHLAKAEIDEKDGKITQLESEKKQQQAHIDALDAQLKQETEKRKAYEEHIIGETRKQKQQSDHLKQAMQAKQKLAAAALAARTGSAYGGGGVPVPQMYSNPQMTTSTQYGAGSAVAPPPSWAHGGVSQPSGYSQMPAASQHDARGIYPVRH